MKKELFGQSHGVIPACDVWRTAEFEDIVESTYDIEGIVGYKIGSVLALRYGLPRLVDIVRKYTDLPVIYDHQKASTDIPQMGEKFAEVCKKSDVRGVVLFPQAGPSTEESFISALLERELTPIVGGEMTHPRYLAKDGGFIRNKAPSEMYEIAARRAVEYFVLPGNKPDMVRKYDKFIGSIVDEPKYCMPGIGVQGGDIKTAFETVKRRATYAIIGSSIYKAKNIRNAAEEFSEVALGFL